MYPGIHNFSEIGKLNKVLLHRPGKELEAMQQDLIELSDLGKIMDTGVHSCSFPGTAARSTRHSQRSEQQPKIRRLAYSGSTIFIWMLARFS